MNAQPIVLYVEDDANSRDVMQMILRNIMGCETFYFFEDSHRFLERAHQLDPQPNIILLDIHVPPHDGFQMIQMLRDDITFQGAPIVALTASVMNEEVQRVEEAGFNAIFAKPIDLEIFPTTLHQLLHEQPM
jgi:putative two-component system response regulator